MMNWMKRVDLERMRDQIGDVKGQIQDIHFRKLLAVLEDHFGRHFLQRLVADPAIDKLHSLQAAVRAAHETGVHGPNVHAQGPAQIARNHFASDCVSSSRPGVPSVVTAYISLIK